jgi:hypothetical protein
VALAAGPKALPGVGAGDSGSIEIQLSQPKSAFVALPIHNERPVASMRNMEGRKGEWGLWIAQAGNPQSGS